MRSVSVLLLLVLSLAPRIAGAEPAAEPPADRLTLAEAVATAMERYPAVAVAEARQRSAAAGLDVAAADRLPTASLGGRTLRYQEPVPVTPIHGFTPASFPEFDDTLVQGDVSVRYSLYSGGARAARIGQAEALTGAAGEGLAATRDEIASRTVTVYLRILGLARTLEAHDRRLDALAAERSRVAKLLEVGKAPVVDLRRVDATLAAARADRVALVTTLATAEDDLARLLGAAPGSVRSARLVPVHLAEDLPPTSAEAVLEANPELARARAELRAAEQAVALAGSGRRPRLDLEGHYQELGSDALSFSSEWNVALMVGFTLFDGGATDARIRQATAERDAAAERVRLLETELRGALDRALADAAQAAARTDSLEDSVDSFAEVARVERLRLENGVGIQADYLEAEARLLASRAALTEARYGEAAAASEVARLTGTLNPEWVATHLPESTP